MNYINHHTLLFIKAQVVCTKKQTKHETEK